MQLTPTTPTACSCCRSPGPRCIWMATPPPPCLPRLSPQGSQSTPSKTHVRQSLCLGPCSTTCPTRHDACDRPWPACPGLLWPGLLWPPASPSAELCPPNPPCPPPHLTHTHLPSPPAQDVSQLFSPPHMIHLSVYAWELHEGNTTFAFV